MLSNSIHFVRDHLFSLPVLAKFALGMVMLAVIPFVSRRLRIPAAVGLLLGGIVMGPYVLDIFGKVGPVADFMAELGKLLLMFFAGLEVDLALFMRARNRSIALGIATTLMPLLLGTAVGLLFGYTAIPAIVIGSLLASHTLLGLLAVSRLGLGNDSGRGNSHIRYLVARRICRLRLYLHDGIFSVRSRSSADRDKRLYRAGAIRPQSPWRLSAVEGQERGRRLLRRDAEHHGNRRGPRGCDPASGHRWRISCRPGGQRFGARSASQRKASISRQVTLYSNLLCRYRLSD
jgi:Sodium/hydrogen exchanger family